jgi:hypothetical protein
MSENDSGFNVVVGIVAAFAVAALIVLAGWQIGWWFTEQNQQRTDKLYQQSYGNQTSLRSEITLQIGTVLEDSTRLDRVTPGSKEAVDLKANRYQVVAIICNDDSKVVGSLEPEQERFVKANCQDGNVRPGSQYAK